ncbi:putative peptidoglycan glycosyltransferase FtsW [Oscillospiraceae bacterium NTUH-002-81]|mgnify:CR=1 FL=1|nr:putative peptidoglycan glycosyltransferase FtsW [Oscillospiraceae bacterium NTUH-002-81]
MSERNRRRRTEDLQMSDRSRRRRDAYAPETYGNREQRARRPRPSGGKRRRTSKGRIPRPKGAMDYNLLTVIIFLVCFGLVMLYSTSYYQAQLKFNDGFHYFKRQAIFSILSMGAMIFVSKFHYNLWKRFAALAYLAAVFSVLLLKTPLGQTRGGATRWIGITESISFQPAELCKIAMIIFIPFMIEKMDRKAQTLKGALLLIALGGLVSFLIWKISDNMSSAIIIGGIAVAVVFIVSRRVWPYLLMGGLGAVGIAAFVHFVISGMENSENFRFRRVIAWLNPEKYASDLAYQTMQALYAIGSGGLFGKGLGNSTQKMVLPEAQNDMIFSIICEELGIFGVCIVMVLFVMLLYRLLVIAENAPDLYSSLMVTGIFAHIAIQVVLNIAVVTNTIPNTGVTLPFISYGGTSILFLMAEMGLALGVSRRIEWE